MKALKLTLLCLGAALIAGCGSMGAKMGKDYDQFIQAIPSCSGANVTSSFVGPFWNLSESASAFSTDATSGTFHVADGEINWSFPMIGIYKSFKVAALDMAASPTQLAAAKQIQAVTLRAPMQNTELLQAK